MYLAFNENLMNRNTQVPCPSSSERRLLGVSRHASIDSQLKALKSFSRRLTLALDAFRDDHKVLERLYYKGKNQHRLSLFWRRVSEIRRFCQRLNELHIDQVVDILWKSFFSDGVLPFDRRATKGSWTHFPDRPFVTLVSQKLNMCSALVTRMQERLTEAYRSFTLAMQSGAFLQLILTLVAVVSRIRMVCEVLHSILQINLDITRHILDILPAAPPSILPENTVLSLPIVEVSQTDKMDIDLLDISKSFGPEIDISTSSKPNVPARTIIKHNVSSAATLRPKYGNHTSKKKTKKVKDEIDNIFGF
ncbi:hypothetical protein E4T56_gene12248 [Termitomyces sp. T112]|nr:hypothetical protein E4T56_gene12248 [Termitomyces sp. T112]